MSTYLPIIDERLRSVMALANSCCNPFARMRQTWRQEWYVAYHALEWLQQNRPQDPAIEQLIVILKLIGLPNNDETKQSCIENMWHPLKEALGIPRDHLGQPVP